MRVAALLALLLVLPARGEEMADLASRALGEEPPKYQPFAAPEPFRFWRLMRLPRIVKQGPLSAEAAEEIKADLARYKCQRHEFAHDQPIDDARIVVDRLETGFAPLADGFAVVTYSGPVQLDGVSYRQAVPIAMQLDAEGRVVASYSGAVTKENRFHVPARLDASTTAVVLFFADATTHQPIPSRFEHEADPAAVAVLKIDRAQLVADYAK